MHSPSQRGMRIKYIVSEECPLGTGNCFTDTRGFITLLCLCLRRKYNLKPANVLRLTHFSDGLPLVEYKVGSI